MERGVSNGVGVTSGGVNSMWIGLLLICVAMIPAFVLGVVGSDRYGVKYGVCY